MKIYTTILLLLLFFLAGCTTPKYLSSPAQFKDQVKGLHLEAVMKDKSVFHGEIIEVTPEAIRIIPIDPNKHRTINLSKIDIKSADIVIATTSNDPKKIITLATLTNLAVIGHGFFMVFSVPLNLAFTITKSVDATKESYRVNYPKHISWNKMNKFARFPQGIPSNIDLIEIN